MAENETNRKYHVEVGYFQYNHAGEKICGDVFLSKRIPEENRVLLVLSDGMGHGVKANVLATLTATISLNLSEEHKNPDTIADIIMKALPVCSERHTSYATYTIVDIAVESENVSILEYENPQAFVMRKKQIFDLDWNDVKLPVHTDERERDLKSCTFKPQIEDRIIICSDGITQSGMGQGFAMGWERDNLINYVQEVIRANPTVSASALAEMVVKKASVNDLHDPKDDMSCGVVYFREPRKTMICTGPPFSMEKDAEFARKLKTFSGTKVVCGATTAEIISREFNRPIVDEEIVDTSLPPSSKMEGVDLITEGVLTLGKVIRLLSNFSANTKFGKGPADRLCKILLESDEIHLLVGTKMNESHFDPTLPVEIEIRKNLILRLTSLLSDNFMKVVEIEYM